MIPLIIIFRFKVGKEIFMLWKIFCFFKFTLDRVRHCYLLLKLFSKIFISFSSMPLSTYSFILTFHSGASVFSHICLLVTLLGSTTFYSTSLISGSIALLSVFFRDDVNWLAISYLFLTQFSYSLLSRKNR